MITLRKTLYAAFKPLFFATLLFFSLSASAQVLTTAPMSTTVRGPGGAACSLFTASPPLDKNLFVAWTQGYLSAFNQLSRTGKDIAKGLPNDQITQGLDNYCRSYPQDSFQNAVVKLVEMFQNTQP